ncbi:MAG: NAD(+) diphosphatase [Actinobacteria bacterium]|nr:NAD(+) diphosphatase [Actinomycetota bacterium]
MTTRLHSLALARGTIDRAAHRRTDPRWLSARWHDPTTRVLIVCDGEAVVAGDAPQLVLVAPPRTPDVEDAHRWFLGVDGDGTSLFAMSGPLPDVGQPATLRMVGALLSDRDAGLLTTAVALEVWHATHRHCPRCGTPTKVAEGGMVRVCPDDGSLHHPRVDPAVIMSVIDADDRLLLAHQARWPARRYSTLAGFVEPGESLEQAVVREVFEETGITVSSASYLGSQPWPFPRSLMLGFMARASTTGITEDGVEIADARWFSRAALASAVAARDVLLPPSVSIARRLIERWFGDHLDARTAHRDGYISDDRPVTVS